MTLSTNTKHYSIEGLLQRLLVVGVALVLLTAYILLTYSLVHWLSENYDNVLLTKAKTLVTLTKQKNTKIELDFADEFMPEFEAPLNPEYFQIWLGDGTLLERSRSLGTSDLARDRPNAFGHRFANVRLPDGRVGRQVEVVFLPQIIDKSERTPENLAQQLRAVLIVAREREGLDRLHQTIQVSLLAGMLLMLIMVIVIVKYAVRRGLRPLRQIQSELSQVGVNQLDRRLSTAMHPFELKAVVTQFNELLDILELLIERERRFSADVAHELRTPIAEMRSLAEVAMRWPSDKKLVAGFFRDVLDASVHMQHLTDNLLALARCDTGTLELKFEIVNLTQMATAAWNRLAKEAEEKQLTFETISPESLFCSTSPSALGLILNNIFSNAIAYSPPKSVISITLSIEGHTVRLVLSNPTDQLEPGDLASLFERLWRKEQTRSSEHHVGLGLSLVQVYAQVLGLCIEVDLEPRPAALPLFKIAVSEIPLIELKRILAK